MSAVTRKTEISPVDGTPVKRMFWSIISDYDLKTGLCELVDNAVDIWVIAKKKNSLRIIIDLDVERQLISVTDNAGGVKLEQLPVLIAPGGSQNDPDSQVTGIFGVGSKRAAIALGEQVDIRTRYSTEKTLGIDITPEWLETNDWEIAAYELPDIDPNTTKISISHLRQRFGEKDIEEIIHHLGETYCDFINEGCELVVNGNVVKGISFSNWAYPPGNHPQRISYKVMIGENAPVNIEIVGGLINDRVAELENYGVYFYCNNRLVVKELKSRDVGYFVPTEGGVPHPDASLCRVIVRLNGAAKLMPWNSSKSGINANHEIFRIIRPKIIQLLSHFSKLSRRTKADWVGQVLAYSEGSIEDVDLSEATPKGRLILPPLPRGNLSHVEKIKARNRQIIQDLPWTIGLVESVAAVHVLSRQKFSTRNRMALLLLDSNFEIALKEFIVHRTDLFPASRYGESELRKLFSRRENVIAEVQKKISIPDVLLGKARHYYNLRNKFIHERATVDISDADIAIYRDTIQNLLKILFALEFPDM